jgi:hypothetical protein
LTFGLGSRSSHRWILGLDFGVGVCHRLQGPVGPPSNVRATTTSTPTTSTSTTPRPPWHCGTHVMVVNGLRGVTSRTTKEQAPSTTLTQPRDAGWADASLRYAVPLHPPRLSHETQTRAQRLKLASRGIVLPEHNRLGNNREIETSLHATIVRMTFSDPANPARPGPAGAPDSKPSPPLFGNKVVSPSQSSYCVEHCRRLYRLY